MTLARRLQRLFQRRLDDGAWLKLKHAYPAPRPTLRAFATRSAADTRITPASRIVMIGIGPAALASLKELKRGGFTDVTVVARDALFGGKCVNFGCMPTEFVLSHAAEEGDDLRERLVAFVGELRGDSEREFRGLGYPIVTGQARGVEGGEVVLDDGTRLPFDLLLVAMGSDYPLPRIPLDRAKHVPLEDLWQLPAGTRLAVYAENNVAGIAIGAVATALGMETTLLLAGANPFADLPSFRAYVRRVAGAGLTIHQGARLIRVDDTAIAYESGRKSGTLAYDQLIVASRPTPRMLPIDGATPDIFDLDVTRSALPARPDIVFLGDSGGYFTATEAEAQARLLTRGWASGQAADLAVLSDLPVILDGEAPLAMLGTAWTFRAKDWAEVDFRALGWSKIDRREGKVWYLLDPASGKLDALHICHPDAKALIAQARLLIDLPVTDPRWGLVAPHPSAAEIFRIVAEQAAATLQAAAPPVAADAVAAFVLPPTGDITPGGPLPDWLSSADAAVALTSSLPRRALATCLALSSHGRITGHPAAAPLLAVQAGEIVSRGRAGLNVVHDDRAGACLVEGHGATVRVTY